MDITSDQLAALVFTCMVLGALTYHMARLIIRDWRKGKRVNAFDEAMKALEDDETDPTFEVIINRQWLDQIEPEEDNTLCDSLDQGVKVYDFHHNRLLANDDELTYWDITLYRNWDSSIILHTSK